MTSCGAATAACPEGQGCCVITAPLLAKAGEVVIPVYGDETAAPVLTCKPPGRLAKAVKEAWSVSLGIALPMMPPVSATAARDEARSILGLAFPMIDPRTRFI